MLARAGIQVTSSTGSMNSEQQTENKEYDKKEKGTNYVMSPLSLRYELMGAFVFAANCFEN